jgi:HD-GYP domain-containing protein (c-di-GMP phosphodiesterase class II)
MDHRDRPPSWEGSTGVQEAVEVSTGVRDGGGSPSAERYPPENGDGLADELFRAYEHLGILFEVTRLLPRVGSEDEVINNFVNSLRQTYSDREVWAVCADDAPRPVSGDPCGEETRMGLGASPACLADPLVRQAVAGCQAKRSVVVQEAKRAGQTVRQALAGPVYAGSDFHCAIVVADPAAGEAPVIRRLDSSDMQLIDALVVFCGDLIRNLHLVRALRQLSIDGVRALVSTIDQKDEYTAGHSNRVRYYALMLGRELGLSQDELQMLEWAALLHDVGKIGIRDDVLKKPGRLTDQEFAHIQSHPVRSAEVIRQIPHLKDAVGGVRHHHEHYDGSGYPDGLAGEAIPLQARVIQIADVFDALTTTRPYRPAFDWSRALEILASERRKTVDPELSVLFDRLIRRMVEQHPDAIAEIRRAMGQALKTGNIVMNHGPDDRGPRRLEVGESASGTNVRTGGNIEDNAS